MTKYNTVWTVWCPGCIADAKEAGVTAAPRIVRGTGRWIPGHFEERSGGWHGRMERVIYRRGIGSGAPVEGARDRRREVFESCQAHGDLDAAMINVLSGPFTMEFGRVSKEAALKQERDRHERLASNPNGKCVVCGVPLNKRAGALFCGNAHAQVWSRQGKQLEAGIIPASRLKDAERHSRPEWPDPDNPEVKPKLIVTRVIVPNDGGE